MSTIIKFDLKELRKLANDKDSCVVEKKVTQNLALQPWCLGNLKESVKNLLDYKIGKFDKEFNGILLSYKNLRVLQNIGSIRNDNADVYFQVQADYFIFQPYVGATLKGVVNKKSPTHLGILVHRVFNVVIPRPTEEPGNKWIGASIQEGQQIVFRIVVLDLFGALPYIRGELDERGLKLGTDENDEDLEIAQPLNVSYVNFDKTKPFIQKEVGDGPPQSSSRNLQENDTTNSTPKHQLKNKPVVLNDTKMHTKITNGKLSTHKSKNSSSETEIINTEKSKHKKQKVLETRSKQTESITKQNKKHKRDN